MEEHEPIIERIVHKMVSKHIAGTTMDSALDAAKQLGSSNIPSSLTFLSSNVVDKAKAKYIAGTYSELIRRIARSGIKASVHVPLEQLGSNVDKEAAMENLEDVMAVGRQYKVFVWIDPDGVDASSLSGKLKADGIGIAINESDAESYSKVGTKLGEVKIMFKGYEGKEKNAAVKRLELLMKTFPNMVLSSLPDSAIEKVLKSKYRSEVTVEFGFGYSERKITAAMKKGAKASMLVPFGKDWIKYAMNNVPEGYMRFVASKLLKEDDKNGA